MKLPAVFVSHGAPTLALEPGSTGAAWNALAQSLPRPSAILVVSAHWETPVAQLSLAAQPSTIHDFGGFPEALYRMRYPALGAPDLAQRAAACLATAGIAAQLHPDRGLDHGAWVPLQIMYPEADIPVTQLSLQTRQGPSHAHQVGQALRPLREEGILILASGGMVHNLGQLDWRGSETVSGWAQEFNAWMAARTLAGERDALLDYRRLAPQAVRSHPTEEHFLPFFTALGAGDRAERMELGFTFGSLSMDAWMFH